MDMPRTGVAALDEFLGGSLPRGAILDVYGPGGSGKSQILMRAAAEAAAAGFRAAFVDTTGGFRPERIMQMIPLPAILDNIVVFRATSAAEQAAAPAMVTDADLLLIDGITDLFLYEYAGEEKAPARVRELIAHMRDVSRRALAHNMAVVVSNTIRYAGGAEEESMRRVVDMYTHVKMRLSGGPAHMAECTKWDSSVRFGYTLDASGLRSTQPLGSP